MRKYDDFFTVEDKETGDIFKLGVAWTVSKGRQTYGYNICTLWDIRRDIKVASCNGGGYDMAGTVVAEWIQAKFYSRLQKLEGCTSTSRKYYGLKHWSSKTNSFIKRVPPIKRGYLKTYLDGGCGLSSVLVVAKAIKLIIT